jgi:hypothetical protein
MSYSSMDILDFGHQERHVPYHYSSGSSSVGTETKVTANENLYLIDGWNPILYILGPLNYFVVN